MRKLWESLSELYKCRLNCPIKVFSLFKNRKFNKFCFPDSRGINLCSAAVLFIMNNS